jgi:8-amino-7-oxononanoate synthase
MTTKTSALERKLKGFIERRRKIGTLRQLQVIDDELIDFFSNDYLCFAQNEEIQELIRSRKKHLARYQRNGSTGSRLISGNSSYAMQVEKNLATFYNRYENLYTVIGD